MTSKIPSGKIKRRRTKMTKLVEEKITIIEKVDLVNETPHFCPFCDSASTYYVDDDTYDSTCIDCGHEWEAKS